MGTAGGRSGIVETGTKTKRIRRVPVPAPVWASLRTELPDDRDAFVFTGRKAGPLPLGEYRWAFDNGYVSITPLRLDLTDHEALERVRKLEAWKKLKFA